jgi:hypothetical protein
MNLDKLESINMDQMEYYFLFLSLIFSLALDYVVRAYPTDRRKTDAKSDPTLSVASPHGHQIGCTVPPRPFASEVCPAGRNFFSPNNVKVSNGGLTSHRGLLSAITAFRVGAVVPAHGQ